MIIDYFRANNDGEIALIFPKTQPAPGVSVSLSDFVDGNVVSLKHIDVQVVFAQLVAHIREVDWSIELIDVEEVYYRGPKLEMPDIDHADTEALNKVMAEWDELTEQWSEENETSISTVFRIDDTTRDDLAGVKDGTVPSFATKWAEAEELSAEPGDLEPIISGLVTLARMPKQIVNTSTPIFKPQQFGGYVVARPSSQIRSR